MINDEYQPAAMQVEKQLIAEMQKEFDAAFIAEMKEELYHRRFINKNKSQKETK